MSDESRVIYVYADWAEFSEPVSMGYIHTQYIRGKEIFSFEFSKGWLNSKLPLMLDPDLQYFSGRQYSDAGKGVFGIFLDSAPDRWGRQLIRRREIIRSREQGCPVRKLSESDYLLAVQDLTRMGALRFKLDQSGCFLNDEQELSVPPWSSLRKLEAACRHYEKDVDDDSEQEKWLTLLIAPGSSLGGARPKANILDGSNNLWIAKFPSRSDSFNSGAWEMVVHRLAEDIGINVPESRLSDFSKYGSTFLSRRFDRRQSARIHFSSAMTLLGRVDGDNHTAGSSYLDIAQFIVKYGANPDRDLEELWKRIIFSIAVSNTDDHLRNHGFILTPQGWVLSPAYDINPNPSGAGLSLNISEEDNSLDFDLALSVADYFRLSRQRAEGYLNDISKAVKSWKAIALKLKIPRGEIEFMSPAFQQR